MDFTNAQTPAPNPWLYVIGRNTARTNRFYGLSVLAAMNPRRANTSTDSIPFPPYYIDIEGFATIHCEVVAWPYSTDEAGVSYPGGTCGVRQRCYRRTIADGGGDKEHYTAVPAAISSPYTEVGRCGVYTNPGYLLSEFLPEDPVTTSALWSVRTANSVIPDPTTADGPARALWVPRNLNDQCLGGPSLGFDYPNGTPGQFYENWVVVEMAAGHPGFRGGKITVTNANAVGISGDFDIIALTNDQVWDTDDDGANPPTVVGSFSVTCGASSSVDVSLPEAYSPTEGVVATYWIRYFDNVGNDAMPSEAFPFLVTWSTLLSPRVDIPLPFFSSTRNLCAPGGIIVPPVPP